MVEGEGQVDIDDESFDIRADMTILAQTGKKHQIRNTGSGMLRIFYSFPAVEVERVLV